MRLCFQYKPHPLEDEQITLHFVFNEYYKYDINIISNMFSYIAGYVIPYDTSEEQCRALAVCRLYNDHLEQHMEDWKNQCGEGIYDF